MAALMIVPVSVWAQGTTGTIRGKLTDQATGNALAAVNVFVLETDGAATTMGAFSNAEGEYVIINIPPGRYILRATMMGFKTYEVLDLLVSVGISTRVDFQLEATLLDVGEVVTVTAERPMIQRDVTRTQQSYTIEEMERMAVSTTSEILDLQSNVYMALKETEDIYQYYERGLSVFYLRGGRNAEVAFMIDGMQVTNLLYGGQAANVTPFSLSEMVVMAGGMSAEFGNAMSGVVNMVTREGGSRYDANVELLSSEFTGQPQDDVRNLTSTQGYLGGPVPGPLRLNFFLSGSIQSDRGGITRKDDTIFDLYADPSDPNWEFDPDITYRDMPYTTEGTFDRNAFDPAIHDPYDQESIYGEQLRIHPVDIYSGYIGYGQDTNWNAMLNLSYKLTPSMKFVMSTQINGSDTFPFRWNKRWASFHGVPQEIQDNGLWGTLRYDVADTLSNRSEDDIIDGTGMADFINESENNLLDNTRLAFVWTHQINQSTFYTVRGSYYDYQRDTRCFRFVNDDGWVPRFRNRYTNSRSAVLDTAGNAVWSPNDPMHEVELLPIVGGYVEADQYKRTYGYVWERSSPGQGWEASGLWWQSQHDVTRTIKGDVTSQITTHHQLKSGFHYNSLTVENHIREAAALTNPFQIADYRHNPWEMSFYLQDKIEFDFLIVNVGARYSAANAGEIGWWTDPRNPINYGDPDDPDDDALVIYPQNTNPDSAEALTGDRNAVAPVKVAKLRQQLSPRIGISHPVTDQAVIYFNYGHFYQNPQYDHIYFADNLYGTGPPLIGNPNMEAEKTIQYEIGYKHQFTDIYALELVMWAKDSANLVSSEQIPSFYQGIENPYRYIVFVNYDYASSKGLDINLIRRYDNYFSARVNYSFMKSESNREEPWSGFWGRDELDDMPKRPAVVGWDQPHKVSTSIQLSIPQGVGPSLLGIRPLENSSANVIFRATAGRPYTPTTRERTLERNSGRRPWTYQWDLRLYRDFNVMGLRWSLFADVRNLLDRVNIIQVFSRTGKPDDPGPDATSYSDNYDRFHYYGTPRRINLGLRIFF